jgi:hypothetical protein
MGFEESFLAGVLGVRRRAKHQVGGPKGDLRIPAHKLLIGVDVAEPRPCDQVTLFQWTALHRIADVYDWVLHPIGASGSRRLEG